METGTLPASGPKLPHKRRKIGMVKSSTKVIALPSAIPDVAESYSATDEEISQAIARAQENLLR